MKEHIVILIIINEFIQPADCVSRAFVQQCLGNKDLIEYLSLWKGNKEALKWQKCIKRVEK